MEKTAKITLPQMRETWEDYIVNKYAPVSEGLQSKHHSSTSKFRRKSMEKEAKEDGVQVVTSFDPNKIDRIIEGIHEEIQKKYSVYPCIAKFCFCLDLSLNIRVTQTDSPSIFKSILRIAANFHGYYYFLR